MGAAFAGLDVHLDFVREHDGADAIVVLDGGKRDQGANLRRDFALEPGPRPSISGAAGIEQYPQIKLFLSPEELDDHFAEPRINRPVDTARIIAW